MVIELIAIKIYKIAESGNSGVFPLSLAAKDGKGGKIKSFRFPVWNITFASSSIDTKSIIPIAKKWARLQYCQPSNGNKAVLTPKRNLRVESEWQVWASGGRRAETLQPLIYTYRFGCLPVRPSHRPFRQIGIPGSGADRIRAKPSIYSSIKF